MAGVSTAHVRSAQKARRKHIEILLGRLTAHADVVRHHLPGTTHNATLGLAAEAGVRDVLSDVLPGRLKVTTGFVRRPGGSLVLPTLRSHISPQTDIIIYDASRASPLYGVEGVNVIAAPDVLGVVEVKDSHAGEADLSPRSSKKQPDKILERGALDHIARLAEAAPRAFRAIVLVQGGDANAARTALQNAKLSEETVPHVVYCRSLVKNESYLAFHDYAENKVRFYVYGGDVVSALAGFLRVITGFFAAEGHSSPALSSDLRPAKSQKKLPPLTLSGRGALPSLYEEMVTETMRPDASDEDRLRSFVEARRTSLAVIPKPALGRDSKRRPVAGPVLALEWHDEGRFRRRGSFFTISSNGLLTCADRATAARPWIIGEPIKEYVRRVCALEERRFADRFRFRAVAAKEGVK